MVAWLRGDLAIRDREKLYTANMESAILYNRFAWKYYGLNASAVDSSPCFLFFAAILV